MTVTLRHGEPGDIGFVMATERQDGYEHFIGRWSAEMHEEQFASPDNQYLLGLDGGVPRGFAILRQRGDWARNLYLQRIAIAGPGSGFGSGFLASVVDWVVTKTDTHRLWLHVAASNTRAISTYRKLGMRQEGQLREMRLTPDGRREDALIFAILRAEWPTAAASATT